MTSRWRPQVTNRKMIVMNWKTEVMVLKRQILVSRFCLVHKAEQLRGTQQTGSGVSLKALWVQVAVAFTM